MILCGEIIGRYDLYHVSSRHVAPHDWHRSQWSLIGACFTFLPRVVLCYQTAHVSYIAWEKRTCLQRFTIPFKKWNVYAIGVVQKKTQLLPPLHSSKGVRFWDQNPLHHRPLSGGMRNTPVNFPKAKKNCRVENLDYILIDSSRIYTFAPLLQLLYLYFFKAVKLETSHLSSCLFYLHCLYVLS